MGFKPGIEVGQAIKHSDVVEIYRCGNMGGMRRSKVTGTLVLITDPSKGLYKDKWKDGIIHYTGMGKVGDQILEGNQNYTLYYSNSNGVELHMFEADNGDYEYLGVVKLIEKPYQEIQPDDNGNMRKVWMFPLKAIDPKMEHKDTENEHEHNTKINSLAILTYVPNQEQMILLESSNYCARVGSTIYVKCLNDQSEKKYKIQAMKSLGTIVLPPVPNVCLGREIGYMFSLKDKDYMLTQIEV